MIKFEVGKRYKEGGRTFEIMNRSGKTITYCYIHHAGRFNERRAKEKKKKVYYNNVCEVLFTGHCEVEAINEVINH